MQDNRKPRAAGTGCYHGPGRSGGPDARWPGGARQGCSATCHTALARQHANNMLLPRRFVVTVTVIVDETTDLPGRVTAASALSTRGNTGEGNRCARCIACPVNTRRYSWYLSLGANRRRRRAELLGSTPAGQDLGTSGLLLVYSPIVADRDGDRLARCRRPWRRSARCSRRRGSPGRPPPGLPGPAGHRAAAVRRRLGWWSCSDDAIHQVRSEGRRGCPPTSVHARAARPRMTEVIATAERNVGFGVRTPGTWRVRR